MHQEREVATSATHCSDDLQVPVVTGLVVTCQALVSHYLIHRDDLPPWVQWIRYVSPQFWMSQPVLRGEFSGVKTFLCRHNPIINDEQTTIIKQVNSKQ